MTTKFSRKYSPKLTQINFKYQERTDQWGLSYNVLVELIRAVDEFLTDKGVPTDKWVLYEAVAQRAGNRALRFSGPLLADELDILVEEFTLRGLDHDILFELVGYGNYAAYVQRGPAVANVAKCDIHKIGQVAAYDFWADCSSADYAFCGG